MMSPANALQSFLEDLDRAHPTVLAVSGGADSMALLHVAASLDQDGFEAWHVDHGLNAASDQWADLVAGQCDKLNIDFRMFSVDASAGDGQSPEEAAREARYQVFADHLQPDQWILTAHHRDDQAETLLLNLLRGAGLDGLTAMPVSRSLGTGYLGRPWLDIGRQQIIDQVDQHDIPWHQDPSNQDRRYSRNFLRHEILPRLQSRFPGATANLARTAALLGDDRQILHQVAARDLVAVARGEQISISSLQRLSAPRQRRALRAWLTARQLSHPSFAQMEELVRQLTHLRADAGLHVTWPGAQIRRYRNLLYAQENFAALPEGFECQWQPARQRRLQLPTGQLCVTVAVELGTLRVARRSGGETIKPVKADCHRSLRNLFQEQAVPPWQRNALPFIYHQDRLLAVPGVAVTAGFAQKLDQAEAQLLWKPRA